MLKSDGRRISLVVVCAVAIMAAAVAAVPVLRSRALTARFPRKDDSRKAQRQGRTRQARVTHVRFNTLGVAYMNQQKFADAQKNFEQALAADPKFGVARLNLGISLLSQQKLEPARAALEQASQGTAEGSVGLVQPGAGLQGFRRHGERCRGLQACYRALTRSRWTLFCRLHAVAAAAI